MKNILFTFIFLAGVFLCHSQDLVKVKETNTIPGGNGTPSNLTPCNGKLFFTSNDNTGYSSLWVTGGTDVTTLQLGPATPVLSSARNLVSYKNKLYFNAMMVLTGRKCGQAMEPLRELYFLRIFIPAVTDRTLRALLWLITHSFFILTILGE